MRCFSPSTPGESTLSEFDLAVCPTEDLIEELRRRYRSFIFAGMQDCTLDADTLTFRVTGALPEQWGLVKFAKDQLRQKWKADPEE